jgi:hypothetical protein
MAPEEQVPRRDVRAGPIGLLGTAPDLDRDHGRRVWRWPEEPEKSTLSWWPWARGRLLAGPAAMRARLADVRADLPPLPGMRWSRCWTSRPPSCRSSRKAPTHDGCRESQRYPRIGQRAQCLAKSADAIAGHPECSIWPVPATSFHKPAAEQNGGYRVPPTCRAVTVGNEAPPAGLASKGPTGQTRQLSPGPHDAQQRYDAVIGTWLPNAPGRARLSW